VVVLALARNVQVPYLKKVPGGHAIADFGLAFGGGSLFCASATPLLSTEQKMPMANTLAHVLVLRCRLSNMPAPRQIK